MRLKKHSKQNSDNESTASSFQSTGSYGVFGSECSDFSEYECEERKHHKSHSKNPINTNLTHSYSGATDLEARPLILHQTLPPGYKTISSSSDTLGPAELSASDIIDTFKRMYEKKPEPDKNKQCSLVTIFTVWNTIMGSSLLAMAWGIERAGLAAALLLLVIMAGLCLYTAYLLLQVSAEYGHPRCEVPALCRELVGARAAAVAHVFSLMVLGGASVVYWVLGSNFLYHTVNYIMDIHEPNVTELNSSVLCPPSDDLVPGPAEPSSASPYWDLYSTVPLYLALVMFPLLSFSKVSFFTKFNSLGTLAVVYLVVFVAVKGWAWGVHLAGAGGGGHAAALSGMLALSFYIHNIIITVMGNNARQENNGRDLSIAFVLVTLTYMLVGAVFYICFPLAKSCIEDNILNNFEKHDAMTAVARALLLFQVITVFPLVAYMLRSEAASLLPVKQNRCLMMTINVAIVTMCVMVACFCPNIGTIIRYTGAISGLVHVFALPALLRLRALQRRGAVSPARAALLAAIALFGAANLAAQLFV